VADAVKTYVKLGTDLGLTRYSGTAGAAPLETADSWGTVDLRVVAGGKGGLPQDRIPADLATVAGRDNLAQALTMRLLTMRGALAPLGHPEYGSRLIELIGASNDEATRNRARLYTIEAIAQERRVAKLLALEVAPTPGQPDSIRIAFSVVPINDVDPIAIALEISL
jgi:phage baseplate assembly protein W